ncbi:MAG: hypothetical protein JW795_04650 [Chitinivibrionales bacterium]|nr:hypothetical protein [Chitinivibrionales bacterium]
MKQFLRCLGIGIVALVVVGCSNNPTEPQQDVKVHDGSYSLASAELYSMGNSLLGIIGYSPERIADTNEIIIRPWAFDEAIKSWVRQTKVSTSLFSLSRCDTVVLYDENNNKVKVPDLATLKKCTYNRRVQGSYQEHVYDQTFALTVTVDRVGTKTYFIFNGTIIGTYNGNPITSAIIKEVKRELKVIPYEHLALPSSGLIFIDIPIKTVQVEFGGSADVTVTVTRKSDGKVWIFTVNLLTCKENAVR